MREYIGNWDGGYRVGTCEVYIDNGILIVKDCYVRNSWGQRMDFKREFGERYFGDSEFLIGTTADYVTRILRECNGKDEDGVKEVIKKYKEKRETYRSFEYKRQKDWEKLRDRFDGVVIGVDSQMDVYETGFSVRVLFGSDVSFGGRKRFLAENKIEFVKWVMNEISRSKVMTRRIGDMKFYRPVEIVNLRAHEVEVKFEVKEVA